MTNNTHGISSATVVCVGVSCTQNQVTSDPKKRFLPDRTPMAEALIQSQSDHPPLARPTYLAFTFADRGLWVRTLRRLNGGHGRHRGLFPRSAEVLHLVNQWRGKLGLPIVPV